MLDVKIARIYREMLSTTEDKEVGASNLTEQIKDIVKQSRIMDGFVHVFSVGSTGAIVSIEFEEGLVLDLKDALRRLVPRDLNYNHGRNWKDDNAHSHLRATLLGPQLMVPVSGGPRSRDLAADRSRQSRHPPARTQGHRHGFRRLMAAAPDRAPA